MITTRNINQTSYYSIVATGRSYKLNTVSTPVRQTIKPDPVRRVKPKALFINGTAWSSSDTVWNPGSATLYASGIRYFNVPLTHVVDYTGSLPETPNYTLVENKARSQIQKTYVNLSVAMAELPKTAAMVRKGIMDFYEVYRKIRRRDPNLVVMPYYALREKRLRERWLEYHYGIRPLVMEIDGGLRALNAYVQKPLYFHGKVRDTEHRQNSYSRAFSLDGRSFTGAKMCETVTMEPQLIYRVAYNTEGVAARLAPYGLTNPLLTAWELVPFSFVADWFVNVGDTIASLDNLHSVKSLDVIRSCRTHKLITIDGYKDVAGHAFVSKRTWTRQPTAAMSPLTRLVYNPHLSITRLISATALLRQAQVNAKSK